MRDSLVRASRSLSRCKELGNRCRAAHKPGKGIGRGRSPSCPAETAPRRCGPTSLPRKESGRGPAALDLCRVRVQVFQRNEFQRADVRRHEHDSRRAPSVKRFLPSSNAQTPAIAAFETWEIELRNGRAEIVADRRTETKELLAHHRAHGVQAVIARAGAAVAIAIKARARLSTAGFQFTAQHVSEVSHALILLRQ